MILQYIFLPDILFVQYLIYLVVLEACFKKCITTTIYYIVALVKVSLYIGIIGTIVL